MRRSQNCSVCLIAFVLTVFALPTQIVAHDMGDSAPIRCAGVEPGQTGDPVVGQFPGPLNHKKMANQELGAFSLAGELPGFLGHEFRVRFWSMEPGGMIADHCHEDRPAIVYLLSGKVKETYFDQTTGKSESRELEQGSLVVEGNGTHHWWINESDDVSVTMVAVDIPNTPAVLPESLPDLRDKGVDITRFVPNKNCTVFDDTRCILNLRKQYPHIAPLVGYKLEALRVAFDKDGVLGIRNFSIHPGVAYVLKGTLEENSYSWGPDGLQTRTVERGQSDLSFLNKGNWSSWTNKSDSDGGAELLLFQFDFDDTLKAEAENTTQH